MKFSFERTHRKAVAVVLAAICVTTTLTSCAAPGPASDASREATLQTGRIKVCVTNGDSSDFQMSWADVYRDANDQPLPVKDITVPVGGTQCVYSTNSTLLNTSDVGLSLWRNPKQPSNIKVRHQYFATVEASNWFSRRTFQLRAGEWSREAWEAGEVKASYSDNAEAYASGTANTVDLYILWVR